VAYLQFCKRTDNLDPSLSISRRRNQFNRASSPAPSQ